MTVVPEDNPVNDEVQETELTEMDPPMEMDMDPLDEVITCSLPGCEQGFTPPR